MSSFIPFILGAIALAALTTLWLTYPWWGPYLAARRKGGDRRPTSADLPSPLARDTLNAAIYRDQLAELERDHANGLISEADCATARSEINRRLLDDVDGARAAETAAPEQTAKPTRRRAPTWFALLLLLPLAAASIYLQLGTPAGIIDTEKQASRSMREMETAVDSLAKKLAANPDNPEGWAMLARSYGMLGRWDDAISAFGKIGPSLDSNPNLLATFAEVRFRAAQNQFTADVRELVAKALVADPDNLHALLLAGSDAFQSGRWQKAIDYWERLVAQLDPGSDDARDIVEGIARARAELGTNDGTKGAGRPQVGAGNTAKRNAADPSAVSGKVTLAPALAQQVKPDATVFVFARAVSTDDAPAPRIPLAAVRLRVSDLPYTFTLDDTMAMNPAMKISDFPRVRIEARVSTTGNAAPASGDLVGESGPVKPGTANVAVSIARQLP
ncbi:MAG: c-type cytochrome biogenesis protein CcmI [Rhodocyclaceae bacterium]|nr:c-type cytochrome biogenesis protein CcmI [Rhodocyclaceae bacterium]